LKALRENDAEAQARLQLVCPNSSGRRPVLRDVQHALAREYGFENWKELKQMLQQRLQGESRAHTSEDYQRAAEDFVNAYENDASALDRLNRHYRRAFSFDDLKAEIWRRVYAFRQRRSRVPKNYLQLAEAQMLIAQDAGFGSWDALIK